MPVTCAPLWTSWTMLLMSVVTQAGRLPSWMSVALRALNIWPLWSLKNVHENIGAMSGLPQAIRSSDKRRDRYEETQRQLGVTVTLPSLHVPTRWSSAFEMIRNSYMSRSVLNAMPTKLPNMRSYSASQQVWRRAATICKYLESAASITDCQSGSSYATLSMNSKAVKSLLSKCRTMMESSDAII